LISPEVGGAGWGEVAGGGGVGGVAEDPEAESGFVDAEGLEEGARSD
jgi:hypothetical protein